MKGLKTFDIWPLTFDIHWNERIKDLWIWVLKLCDLGMEGGDGKILFFYSSLCRKVNSQEFLEHIT